MSQVQNSQTVITASGLFTVNKTILSSVSIYTYNNSDIMKVKLKQTSIKAN